MINYILEKLKALTAIPSPSGYTNNASNYVIQELKNLGFNATMTKKGCLFCDLGGEGDSLMLAAHIDTLGGMVQEIKANGRLKITRLGGLLAHNIEAENCKIITRNGKEFEGAFQINNPSVHVNGKYQEVVRDFDNMEVVIDEHVTNEKETKSLGIQVGDIVAFDPRTVVTSSGYIKSRFLDDKLSVATLLGLAKHISEEKPKLNKHLYLFIAVYEEVGHGSSSIPIEVDEFISVDMGCVGDGLSCTERQVSICVKDSSGPLNYELTSRLINTAKKNNLDYAVDVYPNYSADVDAALSGGSDFKHGLIGPGVYASHGYERSHVNGVLATFELLKNYLCN